MVDESMARTGGEIELMRVRMPAVAGVFYPEGHDALRKDVDDLIAAASATVTAVARAAIVPHAGYMYSGPIAASAFAALRSRRGELDRVVLVGPAHRVPVRGLATSSASIFRTPAGDVHVDRSAVEAAERMPGVVRSDRAHLGEHSLEVQLPFLLATLGDVPIVPLVAGDASPEDVAAVLDSLAPDERTLVLVSTDLTHYLDRETAKKRDAATARAIEALDAAAIDDDDACGAVGLRGLLVLAKRRGWTARALDVRTSGDTAGMRDEVVGYGAFVLG